MDQIYLVTFVLDIVLITVLIKRKKFTQPVLLVTLLAGLAFSIMHLLGNFIQLPSTAILIVAGAGVIICWIGLIWQYGIMKDDQN